MDFKLESADRVKIVLTAADMQEFCIKFSDLNYADTATKKMLLMLMDKAKQKLGWCPKKANLIVEAYPYNKDGCVFYVTAVPRSSLLFAKGIEPVVFEFDGVDDLSACASRAFPLYRHRILESSLYLYRGKYRMVVYCLDYSDRLSIFLLSEYAKVVGKGDIFAAYTKEHGKEIIPATALDTLAKHFF